MREILFRGKRTDNGRWTEGYFVEDEVDTYRAYIVTNAHWEMDEDGDTDLMETEVYEVNPETIGQYTGLRDKNNTRIFEGDIVRNLDNSKVYQVKIGAFFPKLYGTPIFGRNVYGPYFQDIDGRQFIISAEPEAEIIGNIHDNPELMEEPGGTSMNLITQFDRPYSIDEHLEGVAILQSIISGECTKCPYYKQCTTDETFCLPPDAACRKRKEKLMEEQK